MGAASFDITSIILTGGRSSRLGREKHAEVIAGQSIIQQAIDRLGRVSREILIVISQRQARSSLSSFTYSGTRTIADLYPEKSTLGGIYTGLMNSGNFYNLVVACDMPFLNVELLKYMAGIAPGFDVVIPRIGDKMEPLHAIYSRNCAGPMESLIKKDNLKIIGFFDAVKVRYVEQEELDRFDPEHLSFFNVNTEADLKKARALAQQEAGRKYK